MEEQKDRMAVEAETINEGSYQKKQYPEEVKTYSGTSNVVRFIDGSNSYRKYYISWFMCDDDSIKPFCIANEKEGRGILSEILGDHENFFRGGYLESKKGQFGKVYVHQAKDPELFKRLTEYWNPSYNGSGTCRPTKEYVYNVIHRNPTVDETGSHDWCKENKHTKLMKFKQNAFKALKVVRDNHGEFEQYDIVFSKEGKGSDTIFTAMKAGIATEYNVVGDITPEEAQYERYDLDYITRLASAHYILNQLHNTIERIDYVCGTNFLEKLEEQQKLEEKAYQEKSNEQQQEPTQTVSPDASVHNTANIPSHEAHSRVPSVDIPQTSTPVAAPAAPGAPEAPSRVPTSTELVVCGHCKQEIPAGLETCPKCGGALLLNCDVCKKPFDAFATECPHCGQSYKKVD